MATNRSTLLLICKVLFAIGVLSGIAHAIVDQVRAQEITSTEHIEINLSLLPGSTQPGDGIVVSGYIRNRGSDQSPFAAMVFLTGNGWNANRVQINFTRNTQRFYAPSDDDNFKQFLTGILDPGEEIIVVITGVGSEQGGPYTAGIVVTEGPTDIAAKTIEGEITVE